MCESPGLLRRSSESEKMRWSLGQGEGHGGCLINLGIKDALWFAELNCDKGN